MDKSLALGKERGGPSSTKPSTGNGFEEIFPFYNPIKTPSLCNKIIMGPV